MFNIFTDIGSGIYDFLHPAEADIQEKIEQGIPLTQGELAALVEAGPAYVPGEQYSGTLDALNRLLRWVPYILVGGIVIYALGPTVATLAKK